MPFQFHLFLYIISAVSCLACMRCASYPLRPFAAIIWTLKPFSTIITEKAVVRAAELLSPPSLCSEFESLGHLSIMSQILRKRYGEADVPSDYIDVQEPKRFHGGEREQFLQLVQLDQTLADDEVECAHSEELVNGVMRSLEEEIPATGCSSSPVFKSTENSVAFDIYSGNEDHIRDDDQLCYLLEASDDELGIPPSPALMLKDEVCISPKETSDGLSENCNLQSLGGNWHFEDDFENYQQFALYEKISYTLQLEDYMNRDFLEQPMIFDGDFPTTWELETCSSV